MIDRLFLMRLSAALLILSVVAPAAHAQRAELTPYIGHRFGGDFDAEGEEDATLDVDDSTSYGLIFSYTLDYARQFEVLLSHQPTEIDSGGLFGGDPVLDLDITYLHIGGTYAGGTKKVRPFVSGGVGLTYMEPDRSDLDSETRLSLSLGIGVKFFFTENVGLRLEARGYLTLFDSSSRVFCSGGCDVRVEASGFQQGEVLAGLVFAF